MYWNSLEHAYASVHESWSQTNPIGTLTFLLEARGHLLAGSPANYREILGRVLKDFHTRKVCLPPAWADAYARHLPRSFNLSFETPSPRVAGLGVFPPDGVFQRTVKALVVPLQAAAATSWSVQPGLPFTADRLQRNFEALLGEPGTHAETLYERFAWSVTTPLNSVALHGSSMDVAALLSVIDAANGGQSPLFAGACAVVYPREDGTLLPVESVREKLEAFAREYGAGALLLHHAATPPPQDLAGMFKQKVPVRNWHDLFVWLDDNALLKPFRERGSLSAEEVARLDAEANRRIVKLHQFDRARELVERAERHGLSGVPLPQKLPLLRRKIGALACAGRTVESAEAALALLELTQESGDLATFDDLVRGETAYASQLFHLARFDEIVTLLEPRRAQILKEPRSFSIDTRVAVFNTLARAEGMRASAGRGGDGWQKLFEHSLDLQRRTSPASSARTLNYFIITALRCGHLAEARRRLDEAAAILNPLDHQSAGYLHAYRADLARREGVLWRCEAFERVPLATQVPPFALGVYFVATARQPGLSPADVIERLGRAKGFFEHESRRNDPSVLGFVLNMVELLRCVTSDPVDAEGWDRTLRRIHAFVGTVPTLREWHEDVLPVEEVAPSRDAVEAVLDRMPYF